MRLIDLTNKQIGQLLVLGRENHKWKCLCTCGKITYQRGAYLNSGLAKSCGCAKTLPFAEASFNDLYSRYKYSAKRKNYAFNLTIEEFKNVTKQNCYYCNIEPKQKARKDSKVNKKYNGVYIFNGIDRIDNCAGYSLDNCRACCGICNKAKRDLKEQEFSEWINRLVKFQSQKN